MPYRLVYSRILWRCSLSWGTLFSDDPISCQDDIKLTRTLILWHICVINTIRAAAPSCSLGPIYISSIYWTSVWHLVEEKNDQDLKEQVMTQSWRVNIPLRQYYKGVLLTLSSESKLFLVVLMDRNWEKGTYQMNGCIPCTQRCVSLFELGYVGHSSCIWSH